MLGPVKSALLALCISISAAVMPAAAQSEADTNASLDALYGDHKPYHQFFTTFQKAVADGDKAKVASLVDYPFQARIKGKAVKLRDAAHFIADYDLIVTDKVKHAVAAQTYAGLFANWQGVMIGDGEVWFSGVGAAGTVKITAIND